MAEGNMGEHAWVCMADVCIDGAISDYFTRLETYGTAVLALE